MRGRARANVDGGNGVSRFFEVTHNPAFATHAGPRFVGWMGRILGEQEYVPKGIVDVHGARMESRILNPERTGAIASFILRERKNLNEGVAHEQQCF
jgi:hypothetical protein